MLSGKEIYESRTLFNGNDESIVSMFKALNDLNRYRILCVLIKHPKLTVSDLAQILEISTPLASQHIKILTQSNLLQKERDGNRVFTKLERSNPFVKAVIQVIQTTQE